MQHKQGSVFAGTLLVAGTSIGGGMLALPVLTAQAGFMPSVCIYILCWLFMSCTGLLFLEASQWIKGESNIISMAEYSLGKMGKYFAWIVYLFLFYCLTIAYMVGCGNIFVELSDSAIPNWLGTTIFVIIAAPLIMAPTSFTAKINVTLVTGLALSYAGFVALGFEYVSSDLLHHRDWSSSFAVLPIAFTSFAYQGIIPTLAAHLHHDKEKIRKAILIGSFLPLIAYVIWEWLILGIVPVTGPEGLNEALAVGQNAVHPLKYFIQNESVYFLGLVFAFFALVTSFIGVTLGLRDFLADGLSIHKDLKGKIALTLLVLAFPLIIAILHPNIFLSALDYAGGFGCALLLGLLPILMIWKERYYLNKHQQRPQLPGGKLTLMLLGSFVTVELIGEFRHLFIRLFF